MDGTLKIRRSAGQLMDRLWLGCKRVAQHKPATIFMFHGVGPERLQLCTGEYGPPPHPPDVFETFLGWLTRRATVLPLAELARQMLSGDYNEPLASFTFDDGFIDNYMYAYPSLLRYSCTASFFVATNMIGHKNGMTTEMLKEMSKEGFSIGSHSVSHPHLTTVGDGDLIREVRESKGIIEDITGRPCDEFCYPYGDYNQTVTNAVREAGYSLAVSDSEYTLNREIFELPRTYIPLEISDYSFRVSLHGARQWRMFRGATVVRARLLPS